MINTPSGTAEDLSTGSGSSSSPGETQSWISWFTTMTDNHFFCRVDKAYIEDSFNLYGLKQYFNEDFSELLNIILDRSGCFVCWF
jgi:hypothetical protein